MSDLIIGKIKFNSLRSTLLRAEINSILVEHLYDLIPTKKFLKVKNELLDHLYNSITDGTYD